MTGLTAKGAATRQRIVEGAATLIREHGLEAATLDEVRHVTATSKGQLFHYFPDGRSELLLAVAHHEAERVLADQQPHLSQLGTWQAWQRWRTAVLRRYRLQGRTCPLGTLMGELGRSDPASAEVTRSLLLRWRLHLRDGVRALQTNGGAIGVDPERFAGAMLAAVQGGVAILLATGSIEDLEAGIDLLLERLEPAGPSTA